MTLKEKLLTLNIFDNNEYLDKYCELIESNRDTKREKFKTQRHHIIPVCYYKYSKLQINNSNDNLVNLTYKDHALAHYYLAMCFENIYLKSAMFFALNYILYGKCSNESVTEFLINADFLDNLQMLYEISKKSLYKQIGNKRRGKLAVYKDGKQYYIEPKELTTKLESGYKCGHLPESNEKTKLTLQHNKMWITNGVEELYINVNDTIPENFYRGRVENYFQTRKTIENEMRRREHVSKSSKGKQFSPETRQKIANTLKFGEQRTSLRKWVNNGQINARVLPKNMDEYIKQGWRLGKLVKNKHCSEERKNKIGNANRGRKYIYKENIMKFVRPEEVDNYLNNGWQLGNPKVAKARKNKVSNNSKKFNNM